MKRSRLLLLPDIFALWSLIDVRISFLLNIFRTKLIEFLQILYMHSYGIATWHFPNFVTELL